MKDKSITLLSDNKKKSDIIYEEDGMSFSTYNNGIKCGLSVKFFKNTDLKEISFFYNEKLHGEYKLFRKGCRLFVKCNYINGKLDGKYRSYYKCGRMYELNTYSKDRLIESIKCSNHNGNIIYRCNYVSTNYD